MFITRHTRLGDVDLRNRLWDFYRRAYLANPLSPFSEVVNRSEFDDALLNSTNRVWVVWEDNRPVVMTLIATDISTTRWLNAEYFRRHHTERMRRGLVHYVMWVVVDESVAVRGANISLAKEALAAEARDGALLVFDLPETKQDSDSGGAAELMLRMGQMVGEVSLLPLATQRYFALDFSTAHTPDPTRASENTASENTAADNIKEAMGTPAT